MPQITMSLTMSGAPVMAVAGGLIGDRHVPQHGAGFGIESNQVRIDSADKNAVAENRNAAIHLAATDVDGVGNARR